MEHELAALGGELCELPSNLAAITTVHTVSEKARESLLDKIGSAIGDLPGQVIQLTKDLELLRRRSARFRTPQCAPEGDEIAPLVRHLSGQQEEHAKLSLELTLKSEDRMRLEKHISVLAHQRARILKTQEQARGITSRLALASGARKALGDYLSQLTMAQVTSWNVWRWSVPGTEPQDGLARDSASTR